MVKGSRHKARRAAVQALYQWQLTEQAPREIEAHFILDHEMNDVDLEYFHHLVPEIPYKVIINEAVELAKTFGAEHGHKYVNAILDKVAAGLRAHEIKVARST